MRGRYQALAALVSFVVLAYGWVAAASAGYLWGRDMLDLYTFPWMQWAVVAPWFNYNDQVKLWLILSAIPPTVILALLVLVWVRRRPRKLKRNADGQIKPVEEGVTDNHGHSNWLPMADAMALFPGPDPQYGGVVVGEAYRVDQDTTRKGRFDPSPKRKETWGFGGKAPLLIDPCKSGSGSTHSIVVGGPGSYKTVSAVTTILYWLGSSVILDPSQELGPMLERPLRNQGKNVHHIFFGGSRDNVICNGFDALAWIDINHPEAEEHIKTAVSWIYDEEAAKSGQKSDDPFFTPMGKYLVTCILAHLLWMDGPSVPKTLETFIAAMSIPERDMVTALEDIFEHSNSTLARRMATTLMGCRAPETFSGIYLNAINGVGWLTTSAYAQLVSRGTINARDLLDGNTTIFVNISLSTLQNTPAIARTVIGALVNTVYLADGRLDGRVLYLLDEAARLGRMKVLEVARDAGRKYGITLQMLLQSMGQLKEIWGEDGLTSWIDAVSWIAYGSVRAGGGGKALSEQLGTRGVLAYSEGDNRGSSSGAVLGQGSRSKGNNINTSEIKRPLIMAAELQQDLRADELIVVPSSGPPIRCGRAIYFRRPALAAIVDKNRFVRTVSEPDDAVGWFGAILNFFIRKRHTVATPVKHAVGDPGVVALRL